ncbi:MAG: hypothetical protein ACPGU0_05910, partial [Marinirhabdus sp.]
LQSQRVPCFFSFLKLKPMALAFIFKLEGSTKPLPHIVNKIYNIAYVLFCRKMKETVPLSLLHSIL